MGILKKGDWSMTTPRKFLHCMVDLEYLKQSINQGLMFTDHRVELKFSHCVSD